MKITKGNTGNAFESAMIAGWEWAVTHQDDDPANPIMIISTSLGGGNFASTCNDYSPNMTAAAANAVAAGITIFVSSGNDGYCNSISWPSCISWVNSVGAVYDANIGQNPPSGSVGCISIDSCVGFTSSCPCPTGNCYIDYTTGPDQVTTYSNSASFLTLLAPSNNAYTTDIVGAGGYSTGDYDPGFGGTSAACPYAAGAAAVLQSAAKANTGSWLTPEQVRNRIVSSGDSITDAKNGIRKSRINLQAAIQVNLIPTLSQLLFKPSSPPPPPPPVCPTVPNGDFESGNTIWTEYSTHGWSIITDSLPLGVSPHSGTYIAWLGGDYDDVSYIQQQVTISSSCFFLTFYHWIASEDVCGFDYGSIRINGTDVGTYELCDTTNTAGWTVKSIDLSAYAGQTVYLQIRTETDGSLNSNWFIDDVSFQTSSASALSAKSEEIQGIHFTTKDQATVKSTIPKK